MKKTPQKKMNELEVKALIVEAIVKECFPGEITRANVIVDIDRFNKTSIRTEFRVI